MREDRQRVIVLDDDPTGSQAARDVRVLTSPSPSAVRDWLDSDEHALYVVTNTRALDESAAVDLIKGFVRAVASMHADEITFVLRGDSTLRGHVRAEIDALAGAERVTVFVPAFPEGGRITRESVHYLRVGDQFVPVAETEFAQDPVFGYRDSALTDWLAVHVPGRPVVPVGLDVVRNAPTMFADTIASSQPGTIVVPDAETVEDVRAVVAAATAAHAAGCAVLLRGSATAAALRAGVYADDFVRPQARPGPTLLVCGSHTAASTRQVELVRRRFGLDGVVLPTYASTPFAEEVAAAQQRLREVLHRDGRAVLATERTRPAELDTLAHGAAVMARLTAVAAGVADEVASCVVKGGITSAEIAASAFGADHARVCGQLEPGVSLWRLANAQSTDYVVVPGNVGDDGTLVRCLAAVSPG